MNSVIIMVINILDSIDFLLKNLIGINAPKIIPTDSIVILFFKYIMFFYNSYVILIY